MSSTRSRSSNAAICGNPRPASLTVTLPVRDYNLAATLASGQAFRWTFADNAWHGVIGNRWVRLRADEFAITGETAVPVTNWDWLEDYLQSRLDLGAVLATFPDDAPLRDAVHACRGLRLLRQEPWECLASFILSSTKQIVQIQQIISLLCERFGEPLSTAPGAAAVGAFPSAERLARATEAELRACRMGFRAPYLLSAARAVAGGELDLERLRGFPVDLARAELVKLPGVGRKIADCVLLFAYGFPTAFPVDVWVMKALRQLYFPKRRVSPKRLRHFSETHFGPHAGYAQQYLFHYMRTKQRNRAAAAKTAVANDGMKTLEVLFTPADFGTLKQRDLDDAVCVVFDVFRATSSMITALANGAAAIIPVEEIAEALAIRKRDAGVLLAGEREGVRIPAALTGGIEFDLGNSPREFTRERVEGKTIAMTTTNGTRALRACAHARRVLIGSFLNLQPTADFLWQEKPDRVLIVCSGTFEHAAYEDILGAGALCELIERSAPGQAMSDSALVARQIFQLAGNDLLKAASNSRNGRRLSGNPELRDDVPFCLQRDSCRFAAGLQPEGKVRLL